MSGPTKIPVTPASIGLDTPLDYQGIITVAADFPTLLEVETGWYYTIAAAVTDNDATKTNTLAVFAEFDEIVWTGAAWYNFGPGRDHATEHVTGGGDIIADAVAGVSSGLLSAADKTAVDASSAHISDLDDPHQSVLLTQIFS